MKFKKMLSILLSAAILLPLLGTGALGAAPENGGLVPQDLDYTEDPVDIPNPDRGFYRAQEYVVPVEGGTPELPDLTATISGTEVPVDSRIIYMEFNLCNFSSNAPLDGVPLGPWSGPDDKAPEYGATQPLTPAALDYVRSALRQVRDSQAVAIVKFNYDGDGNTYVDNDDFDQLVHDCEPGAHQGRAWYESAEKPEDRVEEGSDLCGVSGHEDKNWVQYHLWQLGSVFSEYEDCIMVVKGGIFGPWGEMHSSSYARTAEGYNWLLDALLDYVPASRSILVHAGGVMAWHNVEYGTDYSFTDPMPAPAPGTPAQRFGMFNDSYSEGEDGGFYNDNGSLSEGYALIGAGAQEDFDRNVALTWIRNQNNFYGGETVGPGDEDNIYPRLPNVLYEAAYAHTSHLNTSWNKKTYQLWGDFVYNEENVSAPFTSPHDGVKRTAVFDPVYDGRSGMEYIRDRLGYRLVLRDANASAAVAAGGELRFEGKLQNVGFGNVVNEKRVSVILRAKDGGQSYTAETDLDARDWRTAEDGDSRADNTAGWRDLSFSIPMSAFGGVPAGEYDIYLKINDPKEQSANRRCVQFANHDIWNAELGANRIGSTTVRGGGLVPQALDYTENPVDIPNPDRGFYRGRWQKADTPFGTTPEVDHRVPVDENSQLYHGRQMPPVEGDDIVETQMYNGVTADPYVGGTGVSALPSISFMGFDLCNFSSNAFLSRQAGLDFDADPDKGSPESFQGRTGTTQPLTPYALDYIRGLLQKVREGDGVAFVKFSYDGNGFNYVEGENEHLIFGPEPTYITANNSSAMCDVPGHTDKTWIEYHIWQLKPIFQEYEDVIMCVKTGMLGPWGEQHTSPVARDPMSYQQMLDAYLDAVPASRPLLTHGGGFLAWYNMTYGTNYDFSTIDTLPAPPEGSPEARFGFFNDSYAAGFDDGWCDNGSLNEGSRMFTAEWDPEKGTEDDWWNITEDGYDRDKLATWINKQDQIFQGEGGIGDNVYGAFPGAILEAQRLHTAALNMRHGKYQRWNDFTYTQDAVTAPVTFPGSNTEGEPPYTGETETAFYDPVYEGRTGLEYFRDRLGYRLVLRDANASAAVGQDEALEFAGKIQNVGFGNVVNEKKVSVILRAKDGGQSYTAETDLDARDWRTAEDGDSRADNTAGWRDLSFSIPMSAFGGVPAGEYDIYLKINDPKEQSANRRCVQFANHDIWNAELGANLIGTATVQAAPAPVVTEPGVTEPTTPEIPVAPEAPAVVPEVPAVVPDAPAGTYTVVPGDNLWRIAARLLGSGSRWGELYAANRGTIKDPTLIFVGQVLVVPAQ